MYAPDHRGRRRRSRRAKIEQSQGAVRYASSEQLGTLGKPCDAMDRLSSRVCLQDAGITAGPKVDAGYRWINAG